MEQYDTYLKVRKSRNLTLFKKVRNSENISLRQKKGLFVLEIGRNVHLKF